MSSTKVTPRFLPTLTEIVQPPPLPQATAREEDAHAQRITQRAVAAVQEQLQATVKALLDEQMPLLAQRLQQELAQSARAAVQEALAAENPPKV